jgi:hypothetical protein
MRKISILLLVIFGLITINSCKKEEDPKPTNPFGNGNGQCTFWIESNLELGNISVFIENESVGTITRYHPNGITCGKGDVNVIKNAGTYNWSAKSPTGTSWSGVMTISEGECKTILVGDGGSNDDGGSGDNGTSSGDAIFWVASDFGLGNIDVTCNGVTKTISSFYSSGAPACGSSGCANFSFSPGKYSFTARASSTTWNGDVTITKGGCSKMQFTSSGGGGGDGGGGDGGGGDGGGGDGGGDGGNTTKYVLFYTSNCNTGNIDIYVDNVYQGTISSCYPNGAPNCSFYNGSVKVPVEGSHTWYGKEQNSNGTWTGEFTVTSDCFLVELN